MPGSSLGDLAKWVCLHNFALVMRSFLGCGARFSHIEMGGWGRGLISMGSNKRNIATRERNEGKQASARRFHAIAQ